MEYSESDFELSTELPDSGKFMLKWSSLFITSKPSLEVFLSWVDEEFFMEIDTASAALFRQYRKCESFIIRLHFIRHVQEKKLQKRYG
jgi:hypothetical protein